MVLQMRQICARKSTSELWPEWSEKRARRNQGSRHQCRSFAAMRSCSNQIGKDISPTAHGGTYGASGRGSTEGGPRAEGSVTWRAEGGSEFLSFYPTLEYHFSCLRADMFQTSRHLRLASAVSSSEVGRSCPKSRDLSLFNGSNGRNIST